MRIPFAALGSITEVASGDAWTGETVGARAQERTALLQSIGVRPGDQVVIAHGGSSAFFADLFAVWQTGACAACINPASTTAEIENIAAFLKAKAVMLQDSGSGSIAEATTVGLDDHCDPSEARVEQSSNLIDGPALILFTSGTTGTPKGVVHNLRSILARVALNRRFIGDATLRRTLCVLPTHFGHGLIGNCLTPLLAGGDLLLGPGGVTAAGSLGEIIDDNRVTFMSSVPAFWKMATRAAKPPARETLARVHIGSAPLASDLWHQVIQWSGTREVVNMYGITETANWLSGASAADCEPEDGLIGKMWGGAAMVATEDGRLNAHGDGELVVLTPSVMMGYHQNHEQTQAVTKWGWYHTGDIGRIGPDGTMRLTGRIRNEINRGGIKIHPEDIDLLLERHDAVREACAFGYPDAVAGEEVGVAISLVESGSSDLSAIKAWCAQRLVRDKLPRKWFIVDEIPKTDRGKLNRQNVANYCLK